MHHRKKKILIIEDKDYLRFLMAEVLDPIGSGIEALPTADDGYSFLQEHGHNVAVLITDVRTPGRLDGLDLAKLVASTWPHIKIVLTSGHDTNSLASLNGFDQFLANRGRLISCVGWYSKYWTRLILPLPST
ncbi:response regulator [Pseudomonas asuensis]